ncbi:MAG TPA: hypothetical protein VF201_04125 [Nitrolancea sp.]
MRTVYIVATNARVFTFIPVLSLASASASMILTPLTMHIVNWAASMKFIPRLSRR